MTTKVAQVTLPPTTGLARLLPDHRLSVATDVPSSPDVRGLWNRAAGHAAGGSLTWDGRPRACARVISAPRPLPRLLPTQMPWLPSRAVTAVTPSKCQALATCPAGVFAVTTQRWEVPMPSPVPVTEPLVSALPSTRAAPRLARAQPLGTDRIPRRAASAPLRLKLSSWQHCRGRHHHPHRTHPQPPPRKVHPSHLDDSASLASGTARLLRDPSPGCCCAMPCAGTAPDA